MTRRKDKRDRHGLPDPMPAPGIDGTYRHACVVCLRGTDTGLAFRGEPGQCVAGLVRLGVPREQAALMVPVGGAAGDVITVPVRACRECAAGGGLEVGVFPMVPLYVPKEPR